MSAHAVSALTLADGLVLLSPGGVFVPDEDTVVAADLHVGYTQELRARGYAVPSVQDDELIASVRTMLSVSGASRLVIAGDFVHGPASLHGDPAGSSAVTRFLAAIAPCEVCIVAGNHDRRAQSALEALGLASVSALRIGPHLVHHGDDPDVVREERACARSRGGRALIGHLHPAIDLDDGEGASARVRAFVTAAGLVCLPALSPWSRGGDVRSAALRTQLDELVGADETGVAAVVGKRVIAVGNVLARRSARTGATRPRSREDEP